MSGVDRSLDRARGALVGLAVGDAMGTAVEFRAPGTFAPATAMTGGGAFGLLPGQWTDDTSMALCLAESLVARGGMDARDQMERYLRWYRHGHLSSTGACFDIGVTTRAALMRFERTGNPLSGSTDPNSAGNGSLMRLAPVAIAHASHPARAIEACAESSITTHGAPVAVDACRYLGALVVGALRGAGREALTSPRYAPERGCWDAAPLHPAIDEIAGGSFTRREPPEIRGTGYAAHSLEAALWALHRSRNFREGCLLAVNLGDDADTTAAVFGQIGGAFYGASGIPPEWREPLALRPTIERLADALYALSLA